MKDPVTDFTYPAAWVDACLTPGLLPEVGRGLAVLTSSGKVLRRGFTTGTTAAAACKAAVLSLRGECGLVPVTLPCGILVELPVDAHRGTATCAKDAGDYPGDATAGVLIRAEVSETKKGIHLIPGTGIGRFTRDTPRYAKGEPAISPAPRDCILVSVQEALDATGIPGVRIRLSVSDGEAVARLTLNPRVGVLGGISILGTTGLVEPWDDHLQESALARIAGKEKVVLTTGRIGVRFARLLFPDDEVVLIGSRMEEALRVAGGEVILVGLPGLILRFIDPRFLDGTGCATVEEFSVRPGFLPAVKRALDRFRHRQPDVRVILIDRQGNVLGEST
jgi:cobalt-precorrin-5B (C1)-methyltransferase